MAKSLSAIGELQARKQALQAIKPGVAEKETKKQHESSEKDKEEGGDNVAQAVIGLVIAVLKLVTNLLGAANAAFGGKVEEYAKGYGESMQSVDEIDAEIKRIDDEIAKKMAEAAQEGEEQEDEGQSMFEGMFKKAASMMGEKLGLGGEKEKEGQLEGGEELEEESETDGPEQDGEEQGGFFAKMVQKFVKKYFDKGEKENAGKDKEGEQSKDPQQEEKSGFMKSFEDINEALTSCFSDLDKEREEKNPLKAAAKEALGGNSNDFSAKNAPSAKEPSKEKGGVSL